MTQTAPAQAIFKCWRCNKRLPVDAIDGQIAVIVHCGHCRAQNRLQQLSFRQQVEYKR